jgi:hypothetical protein
MTEGSSGTLYAGSNDGISRYDYGSNTWTHLAQNKASAMSASRDNTLFVSEPDNGGTFEYDGRSSTFDPQNWKTINTKSAIVLAAVAHDRVYASYDDGVWAYSQGNWYAVTTGHPFVMSASSDGTMFAGFTQSKIHGT